MKKPHILFILLAAVVFTVFYACGPEPDPENNPHDPDPGEIFGVDAEAATEAMLHCDVVEWNPEAFAACIAAAGLTGAIASTIEAFSGRSAGSNGVGLAKHVENQILLPSQYKIPSNDYECVGVLHNRGLFRILNASHGKDDEIQKIFEGDEATINAYASMYAECKGLNAQTQSEVVEILKENMHNFEAAAERYRYMTFTEALASSSLPNEVKTYMTEVHTNVVTKMRDTNHDLATVEDYINLKINELVSGHPTTDLTQRAKLVFLSVLKNSYYYWAN